MRKCASASCYEPVESGRCDRCRGKRKVPTKASATARGYDYRHQKNAREFLRAHPICQDCIDEGARPLRPSAEAHHLVKVSEDPAKRLAWSNLRALCKAHHARRTNRGE